MAAIKDRMVPVRDGDSYAYPVKGAVRIFARTLVALTATGLAVPAGTVGAVSIAGYADHHADNRDGADGAGKVRVKKGVLAFATFAGTAPTSANLNATVYAVDDETVSLDSSSGTRLAAGKLDGIEDGIFWVRT